MQFQNFRGAAVAAVTPFTSSGELDLPLLSDLIEWWIAQGIQGLVLGGSTGEVAYLTPDERIQVFEAGIKACNGRIPVWAGTGFPDTKTTIETTKAAADLGANAALVVTPFYYKLSEDAMAAHYELVAAESEIPVFLYNMPPLTNVSLTPEFVSRMSKVNNIVGIKDSAGDLTQLRCIIEQTPEDFCVLTGSFPLLADAVHAGANGAILAMANLIPEACVQIRALAADGDFADAKKLFEEFEYLQDWVKANGIPGIKQKLTEWHHPAEVAQC